MAMNALAECEDADEVFWRYHDAVVPKWDKDGYQQSTIMLLERDLPSTRLLVLMGNHLAVMAVPDGDVPGYEPPPT
jgi:hypothetical protein